MEEFVQRPSERYLKYKKLHHCPKHDGEAKPEDCELCIAAFKEVANLSYSDLDPNAMLDSVDGDY